MSHLSIQELADLRDDMMLRMGGSLLPALTKANREDRLPELLTDLGMEDLAETNGCLRKTERAGKIVVMGDSTVKVDKLRSIARKKGFDLDRFEFQLDYDRLKHYDFGKLRGAMGYTAVLAGPMAHKTLGTERASSYIAQAEQHPDEYPLLIRIETANDLKITNNSFKKALDRLLELDMAAAA